MTDTLLDRPLGDLTLRELTHLGKVAAAVTAALDTLAAPQTSVAEASPQVTRPTVADGIRAVVAGKALPKPAKIANGNGHATGAKPAVKKGPGSGRKVCPKCHETTGARAAECICGHTFVAATAR